MNPLTTYRATDRRCYNGALCSDLKKELDCTKFLVACMKELEPTAKAMYFPVEKAYLVFTHTVNILTDNFWWNKQEALVEAINVLESKVR